MPGPRLEAGRPANQHVAPHLGATAHQRQQMAAGMHVRHHVGLQRLQQRIAAAVGHPPTVVRPAHRIHHRGERTGTSADALGHGARRAVVAQRTEQDFQPRLIGELLLQRGQPAGVAADHQHGAASLQQGRHDALAHAAGATEHQHLGGQCPIHGTFTPVAGIIPIRPSRPPLRAPSCKLPPRCMLAGGVNSRKALRDKEPGRTSTVIARSSGALGPLRRRPRMFRNHMVVVLHIWNGARLVLKLPLD
ncbi:hypothetical protein D3C71_1483740 [compost metagenome]